jgi:tyrosinase
MGDPGLAALDPIFYLHHANIDRMWAGWNQVLGNSNPSDTNWLNGPAACGDAVFVMPMAGSGSWVYTPSEVNSLSQLNYEYESYASLPKCPPAHVQLSGRLKKLGAAAAAEAVEAGAQVNEGQRAELVGASENAIDVKGAGVRAAVTLKREVRRKIIASLAAPQAATPPDRVFLHLENVRGTQNAPVLAIYINLPPDANPSDHPDQLAGSVGLFGLRSASSPGDRHGGQGLSFTIEITRIVDSLHLENQLDQDSLNVTVVPSVPLPDQAPITIGRISIYRKGH